MKQIFYFIALVLIFTSGCKKAKEIINPDNEIILQKATMSDNIAFKEVTDDFDTDAIKVIEDTNSFKIIQNHSDTIKLIDSIPGAIVFRSEKADSMFISYDGITANKRGDVRSGLIIITKSGVWGDVNSKMVINFLNAKVIRAVDGTILRLNGSKSITNKTIGLYKNLSPNDSITQKIRGTVYVEFDGNLDRGIEIFRERTIKTDSIRIKGDTSFVVNGTNVLNICEKGFTRGNYSYVCNNEQDIKYSLCSNKLKMISGVINIIITNNDYPAGKNLKAVSGFDINKLVSTDVCNAVYAEISWSALDGNPYQDYIITSK